MTFFSLPLVGRAGVGVVQCFTVGATSHDPHPCPPK
jgi:hypothetical protein